MNKRPLIVTGLVALIAVPAAVACWTPPVKPCEPTKKQSCPSTTSTTTTSTTPTTVVTTPEPPPATTTVVTTAPVPPTAPEPPVTSTTTPSEPTPAVLPPKPAKRYTCATLPKGAGPRTRIKFCGKPNRSRVCPPAKPFKAVVRGKRVCLASRPTPQPVAVAGEHR